VLGWVRHWGGMADTDQYYEIISQPDTQSVSEDSSKRGNMSSWRHTELRPKLELVVDAVATKLEIILFLSHLFVYLLARSLFSFLSFLSRI
jgi:hypothetical protein